MRQSAASWWGKGPCNLSLALGVPLMLGLLTGILGWPVPWTGETPARPEPRIVPAVTAAPAEPESDPQAAPVASAREEPELRELRDALTLAQTSQLEMAKSLANLRASHEAELASAWEERDRLALKLAGVQTELAATQELRAREEQDSKLERQRLQDKIRKLDEQIRALEGASIAEKRRAEQAEELLRAKEAELRESAHRTPQSVEGPNRP